MGGRALGINTAMAAAVESVYGTPPGSNYYKLALVTQNLGEEQPLLEDDQLGFGREGLDPTYDAITNVGDITVPVNTRGIGFWLRLLLGPTISSTALTGAQAGFYQHIFQSGSAKLPSASIELGNPDVPAFGMNYGAAANTLKVGVAKTGMLNAVLSLIAQGEADPVSASVAGTPTTLAGPRFAQATGNVSVDGAAQGNVTGATFGYTNNLETVDVIRSDGRIGGFNPGVARASGDITVLLDPNSMLLNAKARSKTPVELTFGWFNGTSSLVFDLGRVFLPKPKKATSGPKGVAMAFNWQASGQLGPQFTAALVNDVASYG